MVWNMLDWRSAHGAHFKILKCPADRLAGDEVGFESVQDEQKPLLASEQVQLLQRTSDLFGYPRPGPQTDAPSGQRQAC